jgi:hypothetical protein
MRVHPGHVTHLLVVAGVALRLWQYLANVSLWIDEAALARSIIDQPLSRLARGLDYAQVAPIGFLTAEKAAVAILGTSEYALRAFPLICGLLSLWLFSRIATRVLDGWGTQYAVGLFAIGSPFVHFPSQVKQYSSDILVALVLLALALWLREDRRDIRRALIAGVAGAAVIWCSQPAIFVTAGTGLVLGWLALEERPNAPVRPVAVGMGLWAASSLASLAVALRNVSADDRAYLDGYWSAGMWTLPPRAAQDCLFPWNQLTWLFGTFTSAPHATNGGLNYPWSPVFVLVLLWGFWSLRRRRDVALVLAAPILLTMVAAAARWYPFTGRVIAFLLPALVFAVAAGAQDLLVRSSSRLGIVAPALMAILGGAPVYAAATTLPPQRVEHLRPQVERLLADRRSDDGVYVYYGAGQAMRYYGARLGLSPASYVVGRCAVSDSRAYLRELDVFRGRPRVWILATHLRLGTIEWQTITGYLSAIGTQTVSVVEPSSNGDPTLAAYAFRYDLSDPARLASATAESFSVPGIEMTHARSRWGCYGTVQP